jgi:hypothetical protein
MILLVVGFSATLLFFTAAAVLNLSLVDGWPGGRRISPLDYIWLSLLFPVIAAWFWFRNRDASRSEPSASNGGPAMPSADSGVRERPPSVMR